MEEELLENSEEILQNSEELLANSEPENNEKACNDECNNLNANDLSSQPDNYESKDFGFEPSGIL